MTPEQRIEYGRIVWQHFEIRRHRAGNMSTAEYDLIRHWMDRGLPLAVVLRGIADTGGKPRTLRACEGAVSEAVDRWSQAMGGLTELPEAGPLEEEEKA